MYWRGSTLVIILFANSLFPPYLLVQLPRLPLERSPPVPCPLPLWLLRPLLLTRSSNPSPPTRSPLRSNSVPTSRSLWELFFPSFSSSTFSSRPNPERPDVRVALTPSKWLTTYSAVTRYRLNVRWIIGYVSMVGNF
jgi:hypothetical protein